MKRIKFTTMILAAVTAAQLVSSDPGPQFRDPSDYPPHRRTPPHRRNFIPPTPSTFFNGPSASSPQGSTHQPLDTEPEQALSPLTLGQLPLEARPEFDNPDFSGPNLPDFNGPNIQEFHGQEGQLDGGFVPLFVEDEHEQRRENFEQQQRRENAEQQQQRRENFEQQQRRENDEQQQQRRGDEVHHRTEVRTSPVPQIPTLVPVVHHPENDKEEKIHSAPRDEVENVPREALHDREDQQHFQVTSPQRPFEENKRFEEQESQDVEFLSAPPTPHRRRIPARPRSPAHPNQIPVYNDRPQGQNPGVGNRQFIQNYNQQQGGTVDEEEEEEEEDEPDRLAILLQSSKFSCIDKNNGYYADEEVQCEIFHYCQDRVKHSWLCPEGASFHQVHLICMPRSEDNICERSSTFHFVNDYLYKEIEGPNKTYADRYYPEGFEAGAGKAGVRAEAILAAADGSGGHHSASQQDSFSAPSKKRRPAPSFQAPPTYQSTPTYQPTPAYQPKVDVSGAGQYHGQSFFSGQDATERIHQATPSFQSPEHFPGQFEQPEPAFQSPHGFQDDGGSPNFAAFHNPEEVRVARPRPPQFQPGRRPGGGFARHPAHIG